MCLGCCPKKPKKKDQTLTLAFPDLSLGYTGTLNLLKITIAFKRPINWQQVHLFRAPYQGKEAAGGTRTHRWRWLRGGCVSEPPKLHLQLPKCRKRVLPGDLSSYTANSVEGGGRRNSTWKSSQQSSAIAFAIQYHSRISTCQSCSSEMLITLKDSASGNRHRKTLFSPFPDLFTKQLGWGGAWRCRVVSLHSQAPSSRFQRP